VTGTEVPPYVLPCSPGTWATGERYKTYKKFSVPAHSDGDAIDMPIQGQLYYPGSGERIEREAPPMPLVIIAHGYWDQGVLSYLGYDYLAHHLASWGMLVFSINLDAVNFLTQFDKPHQYARGEIILNVIGQILADPEINALIDTANIGLIGHSMGGEGVVMAQ